MNTIGGRRPGGDVGGRLLLSTGRSKGADRRRGAGGALVGDGWAARQPTRYQGVARVVLGPAPPVEVLPVTPVDPRQSLGQQAQRMRSAPVLERAVKGTGNRISAETLGQRLEVDAAKDADVLRIRVVDSTATGAAQLANAVPTAYGQLLGQQSRARSRDLVRQLRHIQSPLTARLAQIEVKLAGGRRPRFSGHSLGPSQPSCRRSNAGSGS